MSEYVRRGTLLLDVVETPDQKPTRIPRLRVAIESFGLAMFSFFIMRGIAGRASAMLSVFLAAAAISNRFSELLKENRDDIFLHKRPSWQANRSTALGLFAIFAGLFVAYAGAAAVTADPRVFELAFDAAGLGSESIRERKFGSPLALLLHNSAVFVTFFILAFVYRSYGALLAIGFNAFVWAATLATLIARESGWGVRIATSLAVIPHLALEAMAYVFVSMSGVFISLGVAKYKIRDPVMAQVARASFFIALVGWLVLAAGAVAEGVFVPWVFSHLGS